MGSQGEGRNVSAHADGEPIWSPNRTFHRLFILTANTFRRSLTFLSRTRATGGFFNVPIAQFRKLPDFLFDKLNLSYDI